MASIPHPPTPADRLARLRLWIALGVVVALAITLAARRLLVAPAPPALDDPPQVHFTERAGGSTAQSIVALQERLRAQPEEWHSYSRLGAAYLQMARESGDPAFYDKAEAVLERALELEPRDYAALSSMGALALARHQFFDALGWGTRAREVNPNRTYAYGVIVDAQVELGRYDEAVETLQTMADLRPDVSVYTRIAYLRELHGDVEGAIEMMTMAAQSAGAHPESAAWTLTQLGNLYLNQGMPAEAEAEYARALALLPEYAPALGALGQARAAQGRSDEAIALLQRATAAMPLPEFVIALGDLHVALGQEAEAQELFALLGALEQLYRGSGVDMDSEMALFTADHGADPEAAVATARQGYRSRPGIHAADALAWALYRAGQVDEAQRYAEEALRLGTRDALKWYHAGMIDAARGDAGAARLKLETALAINPHFSLLHAPQARQRLVDLPAEGDPTP